MRSNQQKMFPIQESQINIKEFSISPTDEKFACCSSYELSIWDTEKFQLDKTLCGHGNELLSCDWHIEEAYILSAGKDSNIKIWCPKDGKELFTISKHKGNVNKVRWHQSRNLFLSCSKDCQIKIFDIRNLKQEYQIFNNQCEVHCKLYSYHLNVLNNKAISWHPNIQNLFASSDGEGNICFWEIFQTQMLSKITKQFNQPNIDMQRINKAIFDIAWQPVEGQIISSLALDKRIEFWINSLVSQEDYVMLKDIDRVFEIQPEYIKAETVIRRDYFEY